MVSALAHGADAKPVYDKPIYNPDTKSYFELVVVRDAQGSTQTVDYVLWAQAAKLAQSRVYKGVRGRLAVVLSPKTRDFLLRNFRTEHWTWIGLRYWCDKRQLEWSSGKLQTRSDYSIWDPNWNRAIGGRCESNAPQYMGVAFSAIGNGFRWSAWGYNKGFQHYFIEYPTGEP